MTEPLTTGTNGRFQPGNKAAVGHQTRSMKLRAAMLEAVSDEDIAAVISKLVELAKAGDLKAIEMLLNRTIGRPLASPVDEPQASGVDEPDDRQNSPNRILEFVKRYRDERAANAETGRTVSAHSGTS